MARIKTKVIVCSTALLMSSLGYYISQPNYESRLIEEDYKLIIDEEGCRLAPYYCTAGKLTNGVGHTSGNINRTIDEDQAAKWLIEDIKDNENCVRTHFKGDKAPRYVYATLVSMVHNMGCYRIRYQKGKETRIWKYARQENWQQVCNQVPYWTAQPELKNRRAREYAHCVKAFQ